MDAQDFRRIQEAYREVYQELDEVLDTPQKTQSYAAKNAASAVGAFVRGDGKTLSKRFEGAKRGMKKIEKRKEQKEQADIYDIILSHLLDEGYAETPEAAEVIMVNMSEEWRDNIVYEVLDEGYKRFPYKKVANKLDKMYDDPDTDIRFGKDAKRYSKMKRVDSHMKGEVLRTDKREYSPKMSKAKSKYNP